MFLNHNCLQYVLSFVNEKDKNSTFLSSKKNYECAINNGGWKKYISFEKNSNMSHLNFVKLCSLHQVALKRLKIKNIPDPIEWVPIWPENIIFENCGKKGCSIVDSYVSKIKKKIDEQREWDTQKGILEKKKKIQITEDGITVIYVY